MWDQKFEDMKKCISSILRFLDKFSQIQTLKIQKKCNYTKFILISFIKFYTHGILIPKYFMPTLLPKITTYLLHHPNPNHPSEASSQYKTWDLRTIKFYS